MADISSLDVTYDGPLFEGDAAKVIRDSQDEMEREIAQLGVNEVQQILKTSLKHPTGYYQRQVQTERQANDYVVTDGNVVYGPWLEGVSSRNYRTRFKGYAAFRRAVATIQAKAVPEAERVLSKYLRRLD